MTAQTSTEKKNGNKSAQNTAQAASVVENGESKPNEGATAENGDAEQKKRRGAIPTMPICAVYEITGGKTVAAVVSPTGERYEATGRGKGSAMGALVDMGFVLSSLHLDPPAWVLNNKAVPEGAKVLGFATISGFPLPKQD